MSYLAMQLVPSPAGLVYLCVLLRGISGQFFCFLAFTYNKVFIVLSLSLIQTVYILPILV